MEAHLVVDLTIHSSQLRRKKHVVKEVKIRASLAPNRMSLLADLQFQESAHALAHQVDVLKADNAALEEQAQGLITEVSR